MRAARKSGAPVLLGHTERVSADVDPSAVVFASRGVDDHWFCFEQPDRGRVRLSGRDVTDVPAYRRPVNTVFQHYALFPHRTVAGNVAFGLEMKGLPRDAVATRVAQALETVRLPGYGERAVDALSGGQRQRVAMARALAVEPEVLLLDEPMSALDVKLRREMQQEIKELQRRVGITFVCVTHDQEEALTLSDRIAVMDRGRIVQLGTPRELYDRPRTRFVADFLGVRNLMAARRDGADGVRTENGTRFAVETPADWSGHVGIRPERMRLDTEGGLAGVLEDGLYLGDRTDWRVRVGADVLIVSEPASEGRSWATGDCVAVVVPPDAVLLLS